MNTKQYPVARTEAEWRKLLTPEQYEIMREHGTEAPGSCALNFEKRAGTFEALGYVYKNGEWLLPAASPLPLTSEADAMHRALVLRADGLVGCTEGSDEARRLSMRLRRTKRSAGLREKFLAAKARSA